MSAIHRSPPGEFDPGGVDDPALHRGGGGGIRLPGWIRFVLRGGFAPGIQWVSFREWGGAGEGDRVVRARLIRFVAVVFFGGIQGPLS